MEHHGTTTPPHAAWWRQRDSPFQYKKAIAAFETGDEGYTTVMLITQNCICFLAITLLCMMVMPTLFQIGMIASVFMGCTAFNIAIGFRYFTRSIFYLWLGNVIFSNSIVITGLLS